MTHATAPRPGRRVHVDAIELDLRGVSADTATRAAHLLGPALAQAFGGRRGDGGHDAGRIDGGDIDGGRIELAARAGPETLATLLAQRIAERTRGG
jgi:hypothetical protein